MPMLDVDGVGLAYDDVGRRDEESPWCSFTAGRRTDIAGTTR